jgi:Fic-DOC domain mobile mystery protein B
VWRWAGQRRQQVTNIGVEPHQITIKLRDVFDDVRYWHEHPDVGMEQVEIAVRLHHRVVAVHPYPNGNGRHARLMADALLRRYGHDLLPWGGRDLSDASETRAAYIRALQHADRGDYEQLIAFATGR